MLLKYECPELNFNESDTTLQWIIQLILNTDFLYLKCGSFFRTQYSNF